MFKYLFFLKNFVIDNKTKQKKGLKNENRLFLYYHTDKQKRNIFNDGRHITKRLKKMVQWKIIKTKKM